MTSELLTKNFLLLSVRYQIELCRKYKLLSEGEEQSIPGDARWVKAFMRLGELSVESPHTRTLFESDVRRLLYPSVALSPRCLHCGARTLVAELCVTHTSVYSFVEAPPAREDLPPKDQPKTYVAAGLQERWDARSQRIKCTSCTFDVTREQWDETHAPCKTVWRE